jgi:hypothetical protein
MALLDVNSKHDWRRRSDGQNSKVPQAAPQKSVTEAVAVFWVDEKLVFAFALLLGLVVPGW